jgi:hypothetical protein
MDRALFVVSWFGLEGIHWFYGHFFLWLIACDVT